jgi:hypothetical protein
MKNKILTLALVGSFSLFVLSAAADKKVDTSKLPPTSDKKDVTFEKDIKPIFEKSCFKCHGEEKQKSKLRVDTLAATLKGGENGPNVIPGKSADSQLVHAVARILEEEDEHMPPKKKDGTVTALSKDEVGLIRAWIDQGAK